MKTQNLDILNAGENSIKIVEDFTNLNVKDSSYQNSENKKTKFGFINKKPQKSIGTDETTIEESSKKESNKPNKFDPFSLASSKQQEKPMIENENKKKSFGFIKKADNSNELLNINFTDNSNSIYSQPNDMNMIPQQTDNRNNSFLNSQKTNASNNLNLNPQAHYFNVTTQNTNLNQMPINPPLNHQNLNQKFPLDNLYSNYQMPNINPMMMNMYYAQMNSGYMIPNINMMNYPGNMMGGTMLGANHNMMNPGFGMNMINPLAPVEINNNLEKKEPKKVIDESAFDFIKLE